MTASPPARLRLGMVGGGRGAFIGEAHRIAARLDDRYELVAGALSADPQRAIESGRDLRLDPMRCYTDYRGMAQAEAEREDGIDVVSVVTPNVSHHAICKMFLEAGIDVICDKPLTTTLAEAQDLVATVRRTGRLLGVTYAYTGYPMVREARALIEAGALGAVRIVQVEFALGWLSGPSEADSKQAAWRTDPAQSGPSFIVGDLGTHCFQLSEFVTGRRAAALAADLQTMVPGRRLEDNAHILLRYDNGARGAMWVSAVAAGEQVGLRLRVYGEKGPHRLGAERSRQAEVCAARRGVAHARAWPERPFTRRQARDAHRSRPAGGLSRGVCHALPRLCRHPGGAAGGRGARSAGAVGADGRGGRARHGVRRGRAQLACRGRPLARLPAGDLSRGSRGRRLDTGLAGSAEIEMAPYRAYCRSTRRD